jgi:hypothetical protein
MDSIYKSVSRQQEDVPGWTDHGGVVADPQLAFGGRSQSLSQALDGRQLA